MTTKTLNALEKSRLRQLAEVMVRQRPSSSIPGISYPEALKLVHELEVHQIEIELQQKELEQANANLESSLKQYSELYDFAPIGYFTLEESGRIRAVNLAGAALLGLDREQLLKRDFQFSVAPESRPIFQAFLQRVFAAAGKCECELALLSQAGGMMEAQLFATAVASPEGNGELCLVSAIDITARKEAEAQQHLIEARLCHTQKLESLICMAGGVAHNFNNLLTVILGNVELVRTHIPPELPAMSFLKEIVQATQRAAGLNRQLLAFSGWNRLNLTPVDLWERLKENKSLVANFIPKNARLQFKHDGQPLIVEADAHALQQVILNLLLNAAEAIGESEGEIIVSAYAIAGDRALLDRLSSASLLPEGPYVCLEITDNGIGMSAEIRERLGDPFFTTKFAGRGLGLAAVYGLAHSHQGGIEVLSEIGQGTIFRLYLPAAQPPLPEPA